MKKERRMGKKGVVGVWGCVLVLGAMGVDAGGLPVAKNSSGDERGKLLLLQAGSVRPQQMNVQQDIQW